MQNSRFNGVVQSLTLPRNALVLIQEVCNLLEKGAIEKVPPSEGQCGFYSRYFVIPKRDRVLCPILDLRPINRALCKRPFRMLTLKQILEQVRPESVYNISGSTLQLSGDVSGGHFVFPEPFQTRQLCSLEGISEAAGTHGIYFSGMQSGLTTYAPAAAMAEISSPLDSVDFGSFEHCGLPRLHQSSEAVAQPRPLQPGSSPGLGIVARCSHNGRVTMKTGGFSCEKREFITRSNTQRETKRSFP